MDIRPVENVLEVLRVLAKADLAYPTIEHLKVWFGPDEVAIARAVEIILEQASLASRAIENLKLDSKTKDELSRAIDIVKQVFALYNLVDSWPMKSDEIYSGISILGVFVSLSRANKQRPHASSQMNDLVSDVEEAIKEFDNAAIDPEVRQVAQRHLAILAMLLRHIPIFGTEAALAQYFEMMLKIRRADTGATEGSTAATRSVWDRIASWSDRLSAIDKIWNSGAKLIKHADDVGVLDYLPDL